jgi:hypothetical protein
MSGLSFGSAIGLVSVCEAGAGVNQIFKAQGHFNA